MICKRLLESLSSASALSAWPSYSAASSEHQRRRAKNVRELSRFKSVWRRSLPVATGLAASLSLGCVTSISVPPCPLPAPATADELEMFYASGLPSEHLHGWLAAISRYCDAVMEIQ